MKRMSSRHLFLIASLMCALLASLCFVPGLDGGFIFDDKGSIQDNGSLRLDQLSAEDVLYATYSFQPGNGSRPLTMLSFAMDYWRVGSLNPHAFKTTNLLIHALSMLALIQMFRRLLAMGQWPPRRTAVGALLLALAWAIHPLQVSSVLYVVQRMQMLSTLFLILALWAYLAMRQAQMADQRSRLYGVLTLLFWALGFASKEDALMLPLYTLMLELTVLRFRAAQPLSAAVLHKGYLWLAAAGAAVYLLVVVPYLWNWQAYPGRDFSSWERLLTQGRVLVMYLGQMLLPMPSRMPFFYDDLAVSRSLWQPITTLPAWLLIFGLLSWAWRWRTQRPLFSLGVLLFFSGHFMTSNVLNLELAFEHRNNFPLIGAVLAMGDLYMAAWQRWPIRPSRALVLTGVVVVSLGVTTLVRAHTWGEPLRFAQTTLKWAPHSERAWMMLNVAYVDRSGFRKDSPDLGMAIDICEKGAEVTGSAVLLSNAIIYKAIRGDDASGDWNRLLPRLQRIVLNAQNRNIIWTLLDNVQRNQPIDKDKVLQAIEIVSARMTLTANEYLQLAAFMHNDTDQPDKALPFLRRAVELSPQNDPDITGLFKQLAEVGREDWLQELMKLQGASQKH